MHTETGFPAPASASGGDDSHVGWLAVVATLTALVLVLTADDQIYDTNFYSLWEATSLLAGDHPYRDFFEWGVPLQMVMSAGAQLLVGYRLIAEFLLQWLAIVAGAVLSFHIALRLSHSILASAVTIPFTLAMLASTPTFHYPKLLFYPLAVWVSWRYLERPSVVRAGVFGVVTAVAFLFRHDHGLYVGGLAVLTFALTRLAAPASRTLRSMARECVAYSAAAIVVLAPWLIVVHRSEGLVEYVRARAFLYNEWSARLSPYRSLLHLNPVRALDPDVPPVRAAAVSFKWIDGVEDATRAQLERRYGLHLRSGPDEHGRWHYDVQNPYDPALLDLQPRINDTQGFDWNFLRRVRLHLPTREKALMWIMQMALLTPLLVLASAGIDVLRNRSLATPIQGDIFRAVLVAVFLLVIDARLFREPSYVMSVAPLTGAVGARLLSSKRHLTSSPAFGHSRRFRMPWSLARWAVALGLLFVTGVTAFAVARESGLLEVSRQREGLRLAFAQLLASPPIDGYQPAEEARRFTKQAWFRSDTDTKLRLLIRYIHDCTRAGDRILVTGSTPYHVAYYVERPIAGGHLFWHHQWRSDPGHVAQSLALLETQSVPFAFSTHDPVLEDFEKYPQIRDRLAARYVELEGSEGMLLIDSRRQPSGTFGAVEFPCFR